jgi:phosphoglycerate dehydrogenase-like enzyme
MSENRVLILSNSVKQGDEIDALFRASGMVPVYRPASSTAPLTEDGLAGLLAGVAGAIVPTQHVSARVMRESPSLQVLARTGVGYDAIDVEAATALGIVVTNAAGANRHSVAELVMALMLCCARKLAENFAEIRNGTWNRHSGIELAEKTLGLVGFGAIGREVALRARAFSMRVLAYDLFPDRAFAAAQGVEVCGLETLLRESDFVSTSLNLDKTTHYFMDGRKFSLMKKGACFINTSRGGVVDTAALCEALRTGPLACAALDVFEEEPLPADSPLRQCTNVYLSPHIGGQTAEAKRKGIRIAAENVICALSGTRPPCVVNPGVLVSHNLRMRLRDEAVSVPAEISTEEKNER